MTPPTGALNAASSRERPTAATPWPICRRERVSTYGYMSSRKDCRQALRQPCTAWAIMNAPRVIDIEFVAVGERQTIHGSPTLSGSVYRSTSAGRVQWPTLACISTRNAAMVPPAVTVSDAQGRYKSARCLRARVAFISLGKARSGLWRWIFSATRRSTSTWIRLLRRRHRTSTATIRS